MTLNYKKNLFFLIIILTLYLIFSHNTTNKAKPISKDLDRSFYSNYLSGYYLVKQQNLKEANKYLWQTYQIQNDSKVFQDYFISSVIDGDINKAIESLNDNGDTILVNIALALKEIKNYEYIKAKNIIKNIKYTETDKLIMPIFNIWCDIAMGNSKKLLKEFDELEVSSEKYAMVKFQQALALDYVGYQKEAEEIYDELFIDPQNDYYLERGISFYNKIGQINKAKILAEILAKNHYSLTSANKILDISPQKALAIFLGDISNMLLESRFSSQSLIYAQLAYYLDDNLDNICLLLGNHYFDNSDYFKSIDYYKRINNESIFYVDSQVNIAIAEYRLGEKDKAKSALTQLSKDYNGNYKIIFALGEIYKNEQNYYKAIEYYSDFISNQESENKSYWNAYYMRAVNYQLNKNFNLAELDYTIALALNPEHPIILNDLAFNFAEENKNIDQAFSMIKLAITKLPNNPQFLDTIGWILYKKGEYDESLNYLEQAVQLLPYDNIINEHLGDVYWHLGKKYNARYEWQHAYDNSEDMLIKNRLKEKIKNAF